MSERPRSLAPRGDQPTFDRGERPGGSSDRPDRHPLIGTQTDPSPDGTSGHIGDAELSAILRDLLRTVPDGRDPQVTAAVDQSREYVVGTGSLLPESDPIRHPSRGLDGDQFDSFESSPPRGFVGIEESSPHVASGPSSISSPVGGEIVEGSEDRRPSGSPVGEILSLLNNEPISYRVDGIIPEPSTGLIGGARDKGRAQDDSESHRPTLAAIPTGMDGTLPSDFGSGARGGESVPFDWPSPIGGSESGTEGRVTSAILRGLPAFTGADLDLDQPNSSRQPLSFGSDVEDESFGTGPDSASVSRSWDGQDSSRTNAILEQILDAIRRLEQPPLISSARAVYPER